MKNIRILGVLVNSRTDNAVNVQDTLTKFGCTIKTRLGLHEVTENPCSNYGLIILELTGDRSEWSKLESELKKIPAVETRTMDFEL